MASRGQYTRTGTSGSNAELRCTTDAAAQSGFVVSQSARSSVPSGGSSSGWTTIGADDLGMAFHDGPGQFDAVASDASSFVAGALRRHEVENDAPAGFWLWSRPPAQSYARGLGQA